jgi:N-acetylmuramoyl-L-alanine amidase
MKIYIDPGHGTDIDGSKDPGALGPNGEKESTVALAVGKYLQAECARQGWSTLMSRTTEWTTKVLAERASEANKWGADIIISLHCNSFRDPQAHGSETLVYKYGGKAEKVGRKVLDGMLTEVPLYSRGCKEQNVYILRATNAPATLCELAFISNPTECKKLTDPTYQKKWARGICKGICWYLNVKYKPEVVEAPAPEKPKEEVKLDLYKDWKDVPDWAKSSVELVTAKKLMSGDDKGYFNPKQLLTRAEAAVMEANLLKFLGKA